MRTLEHFPLIIVKNRNQKSTCREVIQQPLFTNPKSHLEIQLWQMLKLTLTSKLCISTVSCQASKPQPCFLTFKNVSTISKLRPMIGTSPHKISRTQEQEPRLKTTSSMWPKPSATLQLVQSLSVSLHRSAFTLTTSFKNPFSQEEWSTSKPSCKTWSATSSLSTVFIRTLWLHKQPTRRQMCTSS